MKRTLKLYPNKAGQLEADKTFSQENALLHFSNGFIAITKNRIEEITETASIHGWDVSVIYGEADRSSEETHSPLDKLLQKQIKEGGYLVTSDYCSEIEIINAQATGTFAADDDGFGFVLRPKDWIEKMERHLVQEVKGLKDQLGSLSIVNAKERQAVSEQLEAVIKERDLLLLQVKDILNITKTPD